MRMHPDLPACMRVDWGKTQSKDLAMTLEIGEDLAMT